MFLFGQIKGRTKIIFFKTHFVVHFRKMHEKGICLPCAPEGNTRQRGIKKFAMRQEIKCTTNTLYCVPENKMHDKDCLMCAIKNARQNVPFAVRLI
jgi:hypothetical protein